MTGRLPMWFAGKKLLSCLKRAGAWCRRAELLVAQSAVRFLAGCVLRASVFVRRRPLPALLLLPAFGKTYLGNRVPRLFPLRAVRQMMRTGFFRLKSKKDPVPR